MRIIAKKSLREFWERHPDSEPPLQAWYLEVRKADWASPDQVRGRFSNASILRNNRVVFRIKGNAYRLVAKVVYARRIVYIRFVGTHAEYDRIDAEGV